MSPGRYDGGTVTDAPAAPETLEDARGRPAEAAWRRSWALSWSLSVAVGLAVLMVACGLALAFGWVHLERAMDVRTLFR
jgi:hypothetical protein